MAKNFKKLREKIESMKIIKVLNILHSEEHKLAASCAAL
jgi:hypothetical protein